MVCRTVKLAMGLRGLLTKGRKKSIERSAWSSGFSLSFDSPKRTPGYSLNSMPFTDQVVVAATVGPGQSEPSLDGSPSARVLTNSS